MQVEKYLTEFEPQLQALLLIKWTQFQEYHPEISKQYAESDIKKISKFWIGTEFMYHASLAQPKLLTYCLTQTDPDALFASLKKNITPRLKAISTPEQLNKCLYQFKQEMSAIIIWQQVVMQCDLVDIFKWTSQLADTILIVSMNWCHQHLSQRYGIPIMTDGEIIPLFIVALGKLGGQELNFSSDIDIMFVYMENGTMTHQRRALTHQEFFTKLAQLVLQVLSPLEHQNKIYRVDLRLRPYGQSGALVSSFFALEKYYQEQGRDWERYALVKARIVNSTSSSQNLTQLFNRFVYRKYLDYTAFSALRDMQETINAQSHTYSKYHDIKRGCGGIREIEFTVQAFQIIRGGKVPALQTSSLLFALNYCMQEAIFNEVDGQCLSDAYFYLRQLENCLQMFDDQQTHVLPNDPLVQTRITCVMCHQTWTAIIENLAAHQAAVNEIFIRTISPRKNNFRTINIFANDLTNEQISQYFHELGLEDTQALIMTLNTLKKYIYTRDATPTARKRMSMLLPKLFEILAKEDSPNYLFERLLPLLMAISLRSAYLVLLLENPNTLVWLIKLAKQGDWFIRRITEFPILLDELLDFQLAHAPISLTDLEKNFQELQYKIDEHELEYQMERLRQLKLKTELHIAIQAMNQLISAAHVNRILTRLAELIIEQTFHWAWQIVTRKYGHLTEAKNKQDCRCAIIAYGNLGAYAMNYQSDLDLILIFDVAQLQMTDGCKSISALEFYTKLFQRILTMLSMRTINGVLYDTDTRLRPSGNQGLLVATLQGFTQYQQDKAWTYEHQALVKSRCLIGDRSLFAQLNALKIAILQTSVNQTALHTDLLSMREKIGRQVITEIVDIKSFKNCAGSITDVDFMVQYIVLKYAQSYPELAQHTETVMLLSLFKNLGILTAQAFAQLVEIYQFYQACLQQLALFGKLTDESNKKLHVCQQRVQNFWQKLFEGNNDV